MTTVKFIRGACGRPYFLPFIAGQIGEVTDDQATRLIALRIAVPHFDEAPKKPVSKKRTAPKKK